MSCNGEFQVQEATFKSVLIEDQLNIFFYDVQRLILRLIEILFINRTPWQLTKSFYASAIQLLRCLAKINDYFLSIFKDQCDYQEFFFNSNGRIARQYFQGDFLEINGFLKNFLKISGFPKKNLKDFRIFLRISRQSLRDFRSETPLDY